MARTLKDKVRSRFDVVLREVGGQETWQRLELGFAVVAGKEQHVANTVADVVAYLDDAGLAQLAGDRREIVSIDGPEGFAAGDADWVPEQWVGQIEPGES